MKSFILNLKFKPLLFMFCLLCLIRCNRINPEKEIIGRWKLDSPASNSVIEFTSDKQYKLFIDNEDVVKFIDGGYLKYSIIPRDDSTFLEISDSKGEIQLRSLININDDELIMDFYKIGTGIENEIDETLVYTRLE